MKCGHERVLVCYAAPQFILSARAGWHRRCADCNELLPIGSANDADPAVQVEIRAAEIAVRYIEIDTEQGWALYLHRDGAEHAGWIEHAFDSQKVPEQDGEWAGFLARVIATHDTQHPASTGGED